MLNSQLCCVLKIDINLLTAVPYAMKDKIHIYCNRISLHKPLLSGGLTRTLCALPSQQLYCVSVRIS